MDLCDIYKIMKNHLGYGNPKGKYWFIGMEEKCWSPEEIEKLETAESVFRPDYYSEEIAPFEWSRKEYVDNMTTGGIHKGIAQIIERFEDIHNGKDVLLDYISKNIFFCNVGFLPVKRKDVKEVFPFLTDEQIDADFKNYREKLGQLWRENFQGERKTFLFSGTYLDQFVETLGLDKKEEYWPKKVVCAENNQNDKIYFLYHPSWGGFSKRLTEIMPGDN